MFSGDAALPGEAVVALQRQLNDLRSDLLDERKRRMERRQEASGTTIAVIAALVGIGGLWACANFRSIGERGQDRRGSGPRPRDRASRPDAAASLCGARIRCRAAVRRSRTGRPARAGTRPPSGRRRNRQRLFRRPRGWERHGHGPANEAGHVSPSPLRLGPDRNASPGEADGDPQRHEEAVADCTEAMRVTPEDPLLYLERGKALAELAATRRPSPTTTGRSVSTRATWRPI